MHLAHWHNIIPISVKGTLKKWSGIALKQSVYARWNLIYIHCANVVCTFAALPSDDCALDAKY